MYFLSIKDFVTDGFEAQINPLHRLPSRVKNNRHTIDIDGIRIFWVIVSCWNKHELCKSFAF